MNLDTNAKLLILKAAIAAEVDAAFVTARTAGATGAMAEFYNTAHPSFWIWRNNVTRSEIYHNTSVDGTTWNWTTYKQQSPSEQGAWKEMFMGENANFSLDNLRAGADAIFTGSAPQVAQALHIKTIARRLAKRGERVFATGTGTIASPGKIAVEGDITNENVVAALGS